MVKTKVLAVVERWPFIEVDCIYWKLAHYILTYIVFTASIIHPSCFLYLKMSLLLSLVLLGSKNDKTVNKLDILALGQDSLMIKRLLKYGASFAPRLLMYSTVSDLFAAVSRDSSGTGTYIVNGKSSRKQII